MAIPLGKKLLISFIAFIVFSLFVYTFMYEFSNLVSFNRGNYIHNAHHFLEDPRIDNKDFKLLRALGQYDAQWYLKIVSEGYPKDPKIIDMNNKQVMDGLTYAFFPLYPLLIALFNQIIGNVELSAFVLTGLLLVINFFSLYYVVGKLYTKSIALRTIFLIFLSPFSIFFYSYFTEGLQLLLLVWFSYLLIKKNFLVSGIFLSLLNVSRGNVLILSILFIFVLLNQLRHKAVSWQKFILHTLIITVPFLLWTLFNFYQTGDPFYFLKIRQAWSDWGALSILHNLNLISYFFYLPLHSFHLSRIDIAIVFITLLLIIKSIKDLKPILWTISLLLWAFPLISHDLMSFSRYQIISFPLFIYLAIKLRGINYLLTLFLFAIGLLVTSLYFINWHWIG